MWVLDLWIVFLEGSQSIPCNVSHLRIQNTIYIFKLLFFMDKFTIFSYQGLPIKVKELQ